VSIKSSDLKTIEGQEAIMHRNGVLPIVRLDRLFQSSLVKRDNHLTTPESAIDHRLNIVIVETGKIEFGIIVNRLIGEHDIVIKQLPKELRGVNGFAGATILGDGSVALVLDLASLI
jgi:two-component system chemotaxis sensor kinase CheA